jgi:hypothetical protein
MACLAPLFFFLFLISMLIRQALGEPVDAGEIDRGIRPIPVN